MKDLIENTHSERLIAAMTSNMAAFWSPYGRVQGNILRESSKVVWFYTGIPAAILNGVLFARMETQDVQAVIVDLAAEIEAAGAPALWWLAPDSKPENLSELLESDGLQYAGTAPGMAVDLVSMDEGLNYIPNFQIHEVKDRKGQALWAQVVWIGMGFPEHMAEVYVHLESRLDDPQYQAQRRYIGYLGGEAVATSALVLDSGVAGIYAVATLPQARRKGIGRAMTVHPLIEARQIGYRVGILQSSSMGYPVYQSIGFQEVCTYRQYVQTGGDV